ncbi:MAG TPA: hypothetical protein VHG91_04565 [Longimicrobium sp.]|nr:hypothetical protein [Longimicrobium sp.]
MRKLRLRLDDLQVRSFPTADPTRSTGTVLAYFDPEQDADSPGGATGSTCVASATCPVGSLSCYCYTTALPQM